MLHLQGPFHALGTNNRALQPACLVVKGCKLFEYMFLASQARVDGVRFEQRFGFRTRGLGW